MEDKIVSIMIRNNREHYWKLTEGNEIIYYSLKDKYELATYDKKLNILYLNTRYKDQFKKVIGEIKKVHSQAQLSEYINITTKDLGWEE